MKKQLLLIVTIMSFSIINANNIKKSTSKIGVNNRYFDDAVTFVERGIKFHIFLNGEFDFNTHPKFKKRRGRGVRIERNYRGQIRRIGNVFINYDRRGNVKRIGSILLNYRFGQLTRIGNMSIQIGNMSIQYDRWGNPFFRGRVKGRFYNDNVFDYGCSVDLSFNSGHIYDYDDGFFYRNSFRKNYRQVREDENFYYYRANTNAEGKKHKLIKRRKAKISKKYKERRR
jgi:hypothetical protein